MERKNEASAAKKTPSGRVSAFISSIFKTDTDISCLPDGFTVTAHTGCEGTDDNTLASITAGINAGAQIVEIDLNFLSDGKAVLCHDAPGNNPSACTLPTLDSAFELLTKSDVMMNVDVKSVKNIPAVAEIAKKHGVESRIFFTGVDEGFVEGVKNGAPEIPYYLNIGVKKSRNKDAAYLSSLVEKVKSNGAIGINTNFKNCSAELVEAFRSNGLPVSVWTANNKKQMIKCLRLKPDNITTRYPSLLFDIINKK